MAALGDLVVNLTANTSNFQRGMSNAQRNLRRLADIAKQVASVAVAKFAEFGDQLDKMALRTGVTVKTLSRLKFAAEQSGSSLGGVETAVRGMSRFLLDADAALEKAAASGESMDSALKRVEAGPIVRTIRELNLETDKFFAGNQEERFLQLVEALGKIEDDGRRAGLAMKLFGRSGTDLMPFISGGIDGFNKLAAEADALGGTVTETQTKLGADLTDAFNRVKTASDGLYRSIGEQLAPALIKINNGIASVLSVAQQYGKAIAVTGVFVTVAAGAMKTLTIATKAYAKAAAVAQAFSGPKGWLALVGGLIAAVGAAAAFDHVLGDVNDKLDAIHGKAAKQKPAEPGGAWFGLPKWLFPKTMPKIGFGLPDSGPEPTGYPVTMAKTKTPEPKIPEIKIPEINIPGLENLDSQLAAIDASFQSVSETAESAFDAKEFARRDNARSGFMQKGSVEAVTAILKASMRTGQTKEEKQLKALKEIKEAVLKAAGKPGQGVVVEMQGGI